MKQYPARRGSCWQRSASSRRPPPGWCLSRRRRGGSPGRACCGRSPSCSPRGEGGSCQTGLLPQQIFHLNDGRKESATSTGPSRPPPLNPAARQQRPKPRELRGPGAPWRSPPEQMPGQRQQPRGLTQAPEALGARDGAWRQAVHSDIVGTPLHSEVTGHGVCEGAESTRGMRHGERSHSSNCQGGKRPGRPAKSKGSWKSMPR